MTSYSRKTSQKINKILQNAEKNTEIHMQMFPIHKKSQNIMRIPSPKGSSSRNINIFGVQ